MSETLTGSESDEQVEARLRLELAQGDQALSGVPPVLGHLLSAAAPALVTDDLLAHIRGMLGSLARQLVDAEDRATKAKRTENERIARIDALGINMATGNVILSFAFAIAMEGQLSEELQERSGIDQVLPPLMQELIASDDDSVAELAMATMAAQARFIQSHRRMSMPLSELPAELFHEVLRCWSHFAKDVSPACKTQVEALLRAEYDESSTRVGKIGRLISKLQAGARAALSLDHAGFALFTSALSARSKQSREMTVLSCHPSQLVRLAVALRATGLDHGETAQVFNQISPTSSLPAGVECLDQQRAQQLLSNSERGAH